MATNRAFLLACATVATLGLSVASSTRADARPCQTEDSTPRQERSCLIRSAIRSAMTEAAKQAATAKQAAKAKQAAAKQAAMAKEPATSTAAAKPMAPTASLSVKSATPAAPAGSSCLMKGYYKGTVIFRDACTGEWAQRESNTYPKGAADVE
jgi:hypothetical protein